MSYVVKDWWGCSIPVLSYSKHVICMDVQALLHQWLLSSGIALHHHFFLVEWVVVLWCTLPYRSQLRSTMWWMRYDSQTQWQTKLPLWKYQEGPQHTHSIWKCAYPFTSHFPLLLAIPQAPKVDGGWILYRGVGPNSIHFGRGMCLIRGVLTARQHL